MQAKVLGIQRSGKNIQLMLGIKNAMEKTDLGMLIQDVPGEMAALKPILEMAGGMMPENHLNVFYFQIGEDEFYENRIKLDDWIEFSFKNIGRHD